MKVALVTAVLLSSLGLANLANAASVDKGQALVGKAIALLVMALDSMHPSCLSILSSLVNILTISTML